MHGWPTNAGAGLKMVGAMGGCDRGESVTRWSWWLHSTLHPMGQIWSQSHARRASKIQGRIDGLVIVEGAASGPPLSPACFGKELVACTSTVCNEYPLLTTSILQRQRSDKPSSRQIIAWYLRIYPVPNAQ